MRAQLRDLHRQRLARKAPRTTTRSTLLHGAGGDVTPLTYPTSLIVKSTDQANWADEYARFMRGADVSSSDGAQGIVTHTVAVTGASSDGLYPNFIAGGRQPGRRHLPQRQRRRRAAQGADSKIFNEIQAVNSVFASASLPVSVNARGTYLNQVYMGMFRPDGEPSRAGAAT